MSDTPSSSELIRSARETLGGFLEDLQKATGGDAHKMERVLNYEETLTTSDLGATPESWTEDAIIKPLLDAMGLNRVPGRPSSQRETPDFRLEEECGEIVGENKSPNKIDVAEEELVDDYISKKSWSDYGIATDGFQWVIYRAEHGGDFIDYNDVRRVDLRPTLREIAREKGYIGQPSITEEDVDSPLEYYVDIFTPHRLVAILTEEAPKEFRDLRKRNVEEFYKLYIELLFGESDEYDGQYETCLREDIIAPEENTQKQNDVFSVTLVNRLLFIKFLETRGVLPESFLVDRVENYNEEVPGTLYKTTIEPLFYDLFNTPVGDRRADHRSGWFAEVPYLNGGLFRENIQNESEYDVLDRTLTVLITDLVEGTELDLDLDPAILGSVFEKTINHLSASEDRQKEIGAYYTPNDVTRLINEQTVDEKTRDVIVESYVDELEHSDEFLAEVEGMELDEMLSLIEDGAGWFGNTSAMQTAFDRVSDLKIVDPACGSGHFLTAAMEEVHQVQQSLYRGLNGGDDPSDREKYEMKKQLALNSIYGVDIDPVAGEIAKLRVWLKIVEGNGWREGFSQLPNIDINILTGNSLIGLPEKSSGQASLRSFDLDLDEIQNVREAYKNEEIGRQELNERIEEMKPELRQQYLGRLNHYFEDRIETSDTWSGITESLESLYPAIRKVTVRRVDNAKFDDDQKARLNDAGFRVETRYGKSAKVEEVDIDSVENGVFSSLLEGNFLLDVERRLTMWDLEMVETDDALSYGPFHWVVEFPEAVESNGNGYSVEFDVVIGNPPYGAVLTDVERNFVKGYRTGNINDIAMPFIERELQLLDEGGYFGNIHSMGFLYQSSARTAREVVREKLEDGRIACFGHRPDTVFEGANPRAAVTTGRRSGGEPEEDGGHDLKTSDFILFYPEEREAAFQDIEYATIDGLVLGDRIGDEEKNNSYPKVGSEMSREILLTLRESSDHVFENVIKRRNPDSTNHVVYRSYHPLYWTNPFLENLYENYGNNPPRDFEPMYFNSEVERKAGFLLLQSSTFYHYWMTYENQRDLNWGPIEAFPFPDREELEEIADEIEEIADDMWSEMTAQFDGSKIPHGWRLKAMADRADDLLAPLLGLDEEQVEWVKEYHTRFGRAGDETDETLTETITID